MIIFLLKGFFFLQCDLKFKT